MFGNSPASEVKIVGSNEIIATSPRPGEPFFPVDITVTDNRGGTSITSGSDEFAFVPVSLAKSTLFSTNSSVQSGNSILVTLLANDAGSNNSS